MFESLKPDSHLGATAADENVRLFRGIVLTVSSVIVLFGLVNFLAGGHNYGNILRAIILVSAGIALAAMRAGRLVLAFALFGWGVWTGVTVEAVLGGSVDSTLLYIYPIVILLGGWLLGFRHGYAMCTASIIVILGLAWMQTQGLSLMLTSRTPWGRAADLCVTLLISMVVLHRILKNQQSQAARMAELNTQLSQAESRFAKIGDIISVPLLLTDAATGRIVYLNKASECVLGWTQQDAIGKSTLELGIWLEEKERAAFGAEFQRNGCVRNREIKVRTRDGSALDISISADALEENGRHLTVSVLFDLTERKLVEAKVLKLNAELETRVEQRTVELKSANDELSHTLSTLRHAQKELVQSEKLAALGGLVAGIAHELNTPIGNAMVVASSMHDRAREFQGLVTRNALKRSLLDRFMADSLEGTDLVQRSLQRASDLVHSFKQVAVDQASERQRVFVLNEVVHEIVATLKPNLKKMPWKIDIEIDIPPDLAMDSFPGALGQVTINIVMNAAIHAFAGRMDGRIAIRARQIDNDTVELVFADNGVGMETDVMTRIFDPFFTTRLGLGGSGLGLAIVHQMVTQVLHGKVSVESQPGAGSRFVLLLARTIAHPSGPAVPLV